MKQGSIWILEKRQMGVSFMCRSFPNTRAIAMERLSRRIYRFPCHQVSLERKYITKQTNPSSARSVETQIISYFPPAVITPIYHQRPRQLNISIPGPSFWNFSTATSKGPSQVPYVNQSYHTDIQRFDTGSKPTPAAEIQSLQIPSKMRWLRDCSHRGNCNSWSYLFCRSN